MKILYHGTTLTGLRAILAGDKKPTSPWTLAEEDKMYFVDLDQPKGYNSEDINANLAIVTAFKQGKLQSCMNDDTTIYVIECAIPKSACEPDSSVGYSVPYVQVGLDDFVPECITNIYQLDINPYCKPSILMGMWENGNCNRDQIPKALRDYVENVNMKAGADVPHHQCARAFHQAENWITVHGAVAGFWQSTEKRRDPNDRI